EENGLALVDLDGDGEADDDAALAELQIDDGERARLADLYDAGDSIWRAPITHFTPWDLNWPYGPPLDAVPPNMPAPPDEDTVDGTCEASGSIIDCHNRTLSERLPVAGTPYTLNYRSDRVPGIASRPIEIPLTGPSVPDSLQSVVLNVRIEGRTYATAFDPEPNLRFEWSWDGRDAYGRPVNRTATADVEIQYLYPLQYLSPAEFETSWARASENDEPIASRSSQTVILRQRYAFRLGSLHARELTVGGWWLDAHHVYDPQSRTPYRGDGTRRRLAANEAIRARFAGAPRGQATAAPYPKPALEAELRNIIDVAVGADGSVYLLTGDEPRIYRVDPDGTMHHIAGTGQGCSVGYGPDTLADCGVPGPAVSARFEAPFGLDVAPDGTVYFSAQFGGVFAIDADGMIRHVAGRYRNCEAPEIENCALEGVATEVNLFPFGVSVAPDGSIYVADGFWALTVGRITPDGLITTFAGATRTEARADPNCKQV